MGNRGVWGRPLLPSSIFHVISPTKYWDKTFSFFMFLSCISLFRVERYLVKAYKWFWSFGPLWACLHTLEFRDKSSLLLCVDSLWRWWERCIEARICPAALAVMGEESLIQEEVSTWFGYKPAHTFWYVSDFVSFCSLEMWCDQLALSDISTRWIELLLSTISFVVMRIPKLHALGFYWFLFLFYK